MDKSQADVTEKVSSQSLAAIIVTHRVLGMYDVMAKHCMSELLRRREDEGDTFDFERYIDLRVKEIESMNNTTKSSGLSNLLSSIASIGKLT